MGAGAMSPQAGEKVEQKFPSLGGFLFCLLPVRNVKVRAAPAAQSPAITQDSTTLDTAGTLQAVSFHANGQAQINTNDCWSCALSWNW